MVAIRAVENLHRIPCVALNKFPNRLIMPHVFVLLNAGQDLDDIPLKPLAGQDQVLIFYSRLNDFGPFLPAVAEPVGNLPFGFGLCISRDGCHSQTEADDAGSNELVHGCVC